MLSKSQITLWASLAVIIVLVPANIGSPALAIKAAIKLDTAITLPPITTRELATITNVSFGDGDALVLGSFNKSSPLRLPLTNLPSSAGLCSQTPGRLSHQIPGPRDSGRCRFGL